MLDQDHHYVPVFYLKQWAGSDGKVPYFWWKDLRLIESRISPKYTAFETNLYARDKVALHERHVVETEFFKKLDDKAAVLHQRLTRLERFTFTAEQRTDWAMFMVAANIRTPDMVRHIKADGSNVLMAKLQEDPEELERLLGHKPSMTLLEFAEKRVPGLIENFGLHTILRYLTNSERIQEFMNMEWSAHSLEGAHNELLTCDRPLWYYENPLHYEFAVVMPLSPHVLFVASKNGKLNRSITHERHSVVVSHVNISIISRALERVYGRAEPSFVNNVFQAKSAHTVSSAK